ncbi:unnamed protein product [Sphagnum jensenii]
MAAGGYVDLSNHISPGWRTKVGGIWMVQTCVRAIGYVLLISMGSLKCHVMNAAAAPIQFPIAPQLWFIHILSLQDVKISKLKKPPDHQEGEKFFLRVHASLEDLGIPEATGVAAFWVSEICMNWVECEIAVEVDAKDIQSLLGVADLILMQICPF